MDHLACVRHHQRRASFHPVIVGIVFVKAIGFGPLAGVLTLAVASVGFIGKLFTEAVEEISLKQVESCPGRGGLVSPTS